MDRNEFRQILHNLISNAIKYSFETNGEIKISREVLEKTFQISVKNNDIGIPLEAQKDIFKKFFRAENVLKSEIGGTGLGLYIAKSTAEAMGGSLCFSSIPDEETTFTVLLPIKIALYRVRSD